MYLLLTVHLNVNALAALAIPILCVAGVYWKTSAQEGRLVQIIKGGSRLSLLDQLASVQ